MHTIPAVFNVLLIACRSAMLADPVATYNSKVTCTRLYSVTVTVFGKHASIAMNHTGDRLVTTLAKLHVIPIAKLLCQRLPDNSWDNIIATYLLNDSLQVLTRF